MQPEIANKRVKLSIRESFSQLLDGELPLAIWRLPNENEYHFLLSVENKPQYKKIDFEELGTGFAISPFLNKNGKESLFIKADISFSFQDFNKELNPNVSDKLQKCITFKEEPNQATRNQNYHFDIPNSHTDSNGFQLKIKKAIQAISNGLFKKVVLSREEQLDIPKNFNPISHFKSLSEKYPEVFCSLVYLPWNKEIWLGATPETLVEQTEDGIFKTMALAGTQANIDKFGTEIKGSDALWRQKEIEEQAIVSRFIINCFKKIRVREFSEEGPKTIKAGNLLHLQSKYEVDTKSINFPQIATVMLELLHPTSAVCGMPKEEALHFIKETESYDRSYYSGFLGPININNASHLFVNLRTLRINKNHITRYAGCGITQDSNPQKEWEETEIKLKTILS